jgi:hypothetical protein
MLQEGRYFRLNLPTLRCEVDPQYFLTFDHLMKLPERVVVNIEIIVSKTSTFANTFRVWVDLI